MRGRLAILSFACAVMLSSTARADDFSGCLLGPSDSLHRCAITGAPAVVMAAIAAPVLVIGAAVTVAHELRKSQTGELPPGTVTGDQKKKKPSLTYVPAGDADPYYNQEHATTPNAAVRFNDTATNVATAVTAAAVLGAIIATTASAAKKH